MSNIIILAGGLNTRFKDLQVIPKVLLPLNNKSSILRNYIDIFSDDTIYLVITSKYYDMVKNYIEVNKLSDKIVLIKSKLTGSSYTTLKEVQEFLPNDDVLFVWSDLILDSKPQIIDTDAVIYTNSTGQYRYKAKDGNLTEVSDFSGNVAGIYYLKNLTQFKKCDKSYPDFVDFIADEYKGKFETIEHIVDEYRDLDMFKTKYGNNKSKKTGTRFFNQLTIEGQLCKKECINNQFYHLIDKEIDWYSIAKEGTYIPKIYHTSKEDHYIRMEYLQGYTSFYKYIEELSKSQNFELLDKVYIKLYDSIKTMHGTPQNVSYDILYADFKKEIVEKTIDRLESIKYCLIEYDYSKTLSLLNTALDYVLNGLKEKKYVFIHGDLNGSNIMISPETLDIKFLDPRGYFGNTVMSGPAIYDLAKVLYCIYGYDNFNNGEYIYYNSSEYDRPTKYYIPEWLNKPELKILVGVIYIALAQYIANDILKANIAYNYGMSILKEELNG